MPLETVPSAGDADPKKTGIYLRQGDTKKAVDVFFSGDVGPVWSKLGKIGIACISIFLGVLVIWMLYRISVR